MEKVTKKELAQKIEALESFVDYADNMLTQLNHALPEPLEIKHWRDEQAEHDEVIAILDAKEPKLKQLDQSIFNGLDGQWRFAVMQHNGYVILCNQKPFLSFGGSSWDWNGQNIGAGEGYDTTDWQNSLIERDKVELTGSDLTEQIMKKQKYQPAFVSDESEQDALNSQRTALIDNVYMSDRDYRFRAELSGYRYAVAINNQGEPLTAADVGL